MNQEHIPSLISHLYTGTPNEAEYLLDNHVTFRDPVVIIKGRAQVLSMFNKLNRLFPRAQVLQLECLEAEVQPSRWILRINYQPNRPKTPLHTDSFLTELMIDFSSAGRVKSITEHWKEPLNIRGDGKSPWLRAGRRFLGIGLGVSFP